MRTRLHATQSGLSRLQGRGERLGPELEHWIGNEIRRQVADAEGALQATVEEAQKETLDAFVESVQKRVIVRIARLEHEIARQAGVMTELRETSHQTERSMDRLLAGLDKLIEVRANQAGAGGGGTPAQAVSGATDSPGVPMPLNAQATAPAPSVAATAVGAPSSDSSAAAPAPEAAPARPPSPEGSGEKPKTRRWSFFG
jgi:uncharacterized coiled-coil protein SlyX